MIRSSDPCEMSRPDGSDHSGSPKAQPGSNARGPIRSGISARISGCAGYLCEIGDCVNIEVERVED